MPSDGSGLEQIERKIPHLQYLVALFTEREDAYVWGERRKANFEKVKGIMLRCWRNMKSYSLQMAGNELFRRHLNALTQAVRRLKLVHQFIHEAPRKQAFSQTLWNWHVEGEGRMLRPN